MFENVGCFENVFVYVWCVLYYKVLILMRLLDSLSFSVYMKIFKDIVLHLFENISRSMNNSRTNYWSEMFGDFLECLGS